MYSKCYLLNVIHNSINNIDIEIYNNKKATTSQKIN